MSVLSSVIMVRMITIYAYGFAITGKKRNSVGNVKKRQHRANYHYNINETYKTKRERIKLIGILRVI